MQNASQGYLDWRFACSARKCKLIAADSFRNPPQCFVTCLLLARVCLLGAYVRVWGYRVARAASCNGRVLRREVTRARTDILRIDVLQIVCTRRTAKTRRIDSAIIVVVPRDLGTAGTVPSVLSTIHNVLLDVDRRTRCTGRVNELLEARVRSRIRRVVKVGGLQRAGTGGAASTRVTVEAFRRQNADVADVADVLSGRGAAAGNATEAVVFRVERRHGAAAS